MKKQILRVGAIGCIVLSFIVNVGAQTYKGNLHTTVTHNPDRAAINRGNGSKTATRQPTAQERVMTDNFGQYKEAVEDFKNILETKMADKKNEDFFGLHTRHGIKKWKEDDYVKLATSVNGASYFYDLIVISSATIVKTYDGKPTEDAICAQNALKALKPDCCKDVSEFSDLITKVRGQTNDKMMKIFKDFPEVRKGEVIYPGDRKAKGYSSVIELHPDVRGGEATVFNFDEKKINAHLDALKADKGTDQRTVA